jgi:hypothetical protein
LFPVIVSIPPPSVQAANTSLDYQLREKEAILQQGSFRRGARGG